MHASKTWMRNIGSALGLTVPPPSSACQFRNFIKTNMQSEFHMFAALERD